MGRQSSKKIREMKILYIGSHVDDAELSCGGTIQKLGGTIIPLSYCGRTELAEEFHQSKDVLGASGYAHQFTVREMMQERSAVAKHLMACQMYDTIFTHDIADVHDDHRVVAEESLRIFKRQNIFTYIAPWNGDESPNYFVELTEQQLETKIRALECYKSQAHRPYMNPDFIRAQARYNGMRCGKLYAEGFKVVRLVQ